MAQPMIHLITGKATAQQLKDMAAFYSGYIKVAVDIERDILTGGGEWHADCEEALRKEGSKQEHIWGASYHCTTRAVDFYSLVNIRPRQQNPGQDILSTDIRRKVERVIHDRLEA